VLIAIFNVVEHESAAERAGRVKQGDVIRFHRAIRKTPGKLDREDSRIAATLALYSIRMSKQVGGCDES